MAAAACWLVRDRVGRGAEAGLRGKREGRRWSGRGRATRSVRDALTVGVAGAEAGGRSAFVAGRSQGEATVGKWSRSGLPAFRLRCLGLFPPELINIILHGISRLINRRCL